LIISHHAVIYSGSKPPPLLAGEEGICKQALRVETSKGESLDMASRINFGKPYAVEHNVKLAEIGMISQDAVHLLADYFMDAMGLN
jgi:hypothetical protein